MTSADDWSDPNSTPLEDVKAAMEAYRDLPALAEPIRIELRLHPLDAVKIPQSGEIVYSSRPHRVERRELFFKHWATQRLSIPVLPNDAFYRFPYA